MNSSAYNRLERHLDENYYAGARDDLREVAGLLPLAYFETLEFHEHEDQRELSRLYNHEPHDGPQFNRGQMRMAIYHGRQLGVRMLSEHWLTEEWLAEVLQDSLDMDWTSTDGARAIMRAMRGCVVELPQSVGQLASVLTQDPSQDGRLA